MLNVAECNLSVLTHPSIWLRFDSCTTITCITIMKHKYLSF